jgi:hypothetical protein
MTGKYPSQADGGGRKNSPDGVSDAAGKQGGKGESDGGAYPNPHTKKAHPDFDGGQTGQAYHGSANPNATTEDD